MQVKVYAQNGKESGTAELSDAVFGLAWNADLVYQVVTSQMANQRQVLAHVKGRGEVRGGGRKPWRQKGTGRARHGSIRSPLWKGGGITHGPLKEKVFKKKINKKMAFCALATVLSAKARDKELLVLDEIKLSAAKTKEAAAVLKNLSKISGFSAIASQSVIIVLPTHDPETFRAFRNLPKIGIAEARNITALDLMNYAYLIFIRPAAEIFEKRLVASKSNHPGRKKERAAV